MKQRLVFCLGCLFTFSILLALGNVNPARGQQPKLTTTPPPPPLLPTSAPSDLPPDTKEIVFGKPILEMLDPAVPGRYYKFDGKANQLVRVTLEPKSGNFFSSVTVLDAHLEESLGGTIGEQVIGGSVIVKLPDDGLYIIGVDYYIITGTGGTPPNPAGSYEISISEVKLK